MFLFSLQLWHDSGAYQGGEAERRPEILLHEPLWEVQDPSTHTLENGSPDSEDRHDHYTSMYKEQPQNRMIMLDLFHTYSGKNANMYLRDFSKQTKPKFHSPHTPETPAKQPIKWQQLTAFKGTRWNGCNWLKFKQHIEMVRGDSKWL